MSRKWTGLASLWIVVLVMLFPPLGGSSPKVVKVTEGPPTQFVVKMLDTQGLVLQPMFPLGLMTTPDGAVSITKGEVLTCTPTKRTSDDRMVLVCKNGVVLAVEGFVWGLQ